ncbi:MAG: transcriptional regulator, partial [Bosea sp. (in: a-proteobacteria)]
MTAQFIMTATGERLVVLPEAEYAALLAIAEDAEDGEIIREFKRKLAAGEEELVPSAVVDRILNGENLVRVWREHRG